MECRDCTEHSGLDARVHGCEKMAEVPTVSLKLFIPVVALLVIFLMGLLGFNSTVLSKINSVDKAQAVVQIQMQEVQKDISGIQTSIGRIEQVLTGE